MDYLILGLLMFKPMTVYELNQSVKRGLSLIYAASNGSIQNGIKKLMQSGFVTCDEVVENGRNKKIYTINQAGTDAFYIWMSKDVSVNKLEVEVLSRVYFLGFVKDNEKRLSILNNMKAITLKHYESLLDFEVQLSQVQVAKEHQDIAFYQKTTLSYGVGSHKFAVDWLDKIINETKELMDK